MYELIEANRRRTILLIAAFALIISAIGWVFGELTGVGYWGLAGAALFALLMSWGSYFYSDRIALAMSKARPADPNQHRQLINIVETLAIAGGMPAPRVYVVEDPAPNAFATGRNPEHAAVAATTGLIEKMNRAELEGVIGHELAHIRNYDILVTTIAVTLTLVVMLLSDWLLRLFRFGGIGRRRSTQAAAPVFVVLAIAGLVLAILAPLFAQLIRAAVSRRRESLADVSGIQLTRYPEGLIGALEKLRDDSTVVVSGSRATAHLWIESPLQKEGKGVVPWINRLFETHPPLEQRIEALKNMNRK